MVTFVESPLFTKQVHDYLTDTEYGVFQEYLASNPNMGDVVCGSGVRHLVCIKNKNMCVLNNLFVSSFGILC